MPTISVIGHLPTDSASALYNTDPGTDYLDLARQFGSSQAWSITGNQSDYANSLQGISSYIVKAAQNSLVLDIPAYSQMQAVSVKRVGSTVWTPLSMAQWQWLGQTLSLSVQPALGIGDQVEYQYY
jgi:hypothetical protein